MNSGNNGKVIQVDHLCASFGRVRAVDQASFVVERGEVYALLGRNGSGKSTTIRCLLGQLRPSAGRTMIFGEDSWSARHRLMARVGVAPEVGDIPPDMTGRQVSKFAGSLYDSWDTGAFMDRLETFAVDPGRRFSKLSRGQRKQVGLALALSSSPELAILDDPTLGLDAVARKALFEELIDELAERGTTVLVATHDLAGIEGVASRVGIMREGRIVVDDDLESLKAGFRRVRFRSEDEVDLESFDGVFDRSSTDGWQELVVPEYTQALARKVEEVAAEPPMVDPLTLEQIFVAVSNKVEGGRS